MLMHAIFDDENIPFGLCYRRLKEVGGKREEEVAAVCLVLVRLFCFTAILYHRRIAYECHDNL